MRELILLVGPTCSGKSTLERAMNDHGIPSVVSYTTRTPREGETHGVDYFFISPDEAEQLEENGSVVQKVVFSGESYGSTIFALEKAFSESSIAVIVVEPTGVAQYREFAEKTGSFEVIPVYVCASIETLTSRLIERFKKESNPDPAKFWQRLVQMWESHRQWAMYTDWSYTVINDPADEDYEGIEMEMEAMLAAVSQNIHQ